VDGQVTGLNVSKQVAQGQANDSTRGQQAPHHHYRTAATIVGALSGGSAGNTVEHAVHKATSYDMQVRMGDGSYRNFTYQAEPGLQVGQRVHVSGDSLSAS
jgi:outer membrane lipoprotein SlyB